MTPRYAAYGLCAVLAVLASLIGVDSCRQRQGTQAEQQAEQQAQQHTQEATSHAIQAQAIPDHSAALATEKANANRAWSEVRRLRALVAAQAPGVPDPAEGHGAPVGGPAVDHRDELLVAQDELIAKQESQIAALGLALTDEQRRSEQFRLAYEAERKATAAQAAATAAWKKAVTTSRWRGRAEGFVAGVALGYVARGQR